MLSSNIGSGKWVSVTDRLPKPGEFVRYRTNHFMAAGRCDSNGAWTGADGKPEPAQVMAWLDDPIS